jgi:hypothetical protein
MTVQTFLKGLFMVLVSVIVSGFSQTPIDFAFMGISALAVILGYTGANLTKLIPSLSEAGKFSWADAGAALLVALSTGITESIALIVIEHRIIWLVMVKVVGSVTFTFIGSSLFSPPNSQSKKLKLFNLAA